MNIKVSSRLLYASLFLLTGFQFGCSKPEMKSSLTLDNKSVAAASAAAITTFVHPGVLNTQESLQQVANETNGGDPTRLASYQKVLDFIDSHDYPTSFYETVVVGSNGATSPSKSQIRKDAELVYAIALRWTKTGNALYAQQAIGILNGWSYKFKRYSLLNSSTNAYQPSLEASWTTPSFVAAAEIIRYYKVNGTVSAGWSDADIAQFSTFLNIVKNDYINVIPDYSNNWDVSAGYAKMAIGIFLNSTSVYTNGYNLLLANLNDVIAADGTCPELCDRQDCVHYQYSLTAVAYAAELAKIQGDVSLWTANGNRISKGYDFMKAAYARTTGCNYCSASSTVFPGVEVAYNHLKTSNLKYLRELQDPLSVTSDNTFLGFTSYTHFNVPSL
jgi:hypothetical protein